MLGTIERGEGECVEDQSVARKKDDALILKLKLKLGYTNATNFSKKKKQKKAKTKKKAKKRSDKNSKSYIEWRWVRENSSIRALRIGGGCKKNPPGF